MQGIVGRTALALFALLAGIAMVKGASTLQSCRGSREVSFQRPSLESGIRGLSASRSAHC